MQFPLNTVSQPLRGREAQRVALVLHQGGSICNAQAARTIAQILARRQAWDK